MEIIKDLIPVFIEHEVILSFIGGFMLQEIVIFLAILSGAKVIPLWIVVTFGFIGNVIHDILFFFIGKSRYLARFNKRFRISNKSKEIVRFLDKFRGKDNFFPLFLCKFIYGTRMLTIVYVSHRERLFSRFLLVDTLANILWFAIMMPIAWLAGKGFIEALHIIKGFEKIMTLIFVFSILIILINKFLIHSIRNRASN